ncbi:MAG: M57 family metalloprotease [Nocardioidaceae bacterium]
MAGLLAASVIVAGGPSALAGELGSATAGAVSGESGPVDPGGLDLGNDTVVVGGPARAARFVPRKWPGKAIRYWAKLPKSYQWSLDAAIKSWNDTGLKLKLKLVKSKAKANATIRIDPRIGSDGLATVGYTRGYNWIKLMPGEVYGSGAGLAYSRTMLAHIIAHEIGHNLGLRHNTRVQCALMQPFLDGGSCPLLDKQRPGYYVCQIVDKAALVPMVRKYGGTKTLGAGKNCTFDPLPPTVTFTWSGGLEGDAPIQVSWTPPRKAPAGTMVDILYNTSCTFPVVRNGYGIPVSLGQRQARVPISKGSWTQPTNQRLERGCYGAQAVNKSGAGRPVQSATLTSYVAQPAAPVAGLPRRMVWSDGYYKVPVTLPSGDDVDLAVIAAKTGQCPAAWPVGEQFADHQAGVDSGAVMVQSDLTNPCFALFTVAASARASVPTVVQIGAEPPPAALTSATLKREFAQDYLSIDVAYDSDVQLDPVAIASPKDSCVSSWPAEESPDDHVATWSVADGGHDFPCVTFFPRNASGELGAPLQVQLQPAAAPVTPTVSNLRWVAAGWAYKAEVDIRTDLHLVVYQAPKGQCVSEWPATELLSETFVESGEAWIWPGYDENWNEIEEPCMSFFAFNDDGVASAPVQVQTQAH